MIAFLRVELIERPGYVARRVFVLVDELAGVLADVVGRGWLVVAVARCA